MRLAIKAPIYHKLLASDQPSCAGRAFPLRVRNDRLPGEQLIMHIALSQITEALLASGADAIVATDRDGIIRHWNPGAERIFGHSAAEAVGQSLDLIIPAQLRARHWEGYRRVMQTGQSRYGEGDVLAVPGLRKDGTRVSLEFTIAMIRDEAGAMIGVAAILRDVTTRFEEMKALRRKLAERG
jgi:PAS domain S-box-containing protein